MPLWLLFIILIPGLILLMNAIIMRSKTAPLLARGSQAPDFSLQDEKGDTYSLSSLRGKKIALIFYPKPNTPGCTKEMCSLRDTFSEFQDAGILVLGVSKGSPEDMQHFKETHHLSFPLLRATEEILEKYGTKGDISSLFLPKRYTFLIDEEGTIVSVISDVDVTNHAEQVLNEFSKQHTNSPQNNDPTQKQD